MEKGNRLLLEVGTSIVGRYGLIRIILCILFCWVVIPLIALVVMIAKNGSVLYRIYEDKTVSMSGVFSNHESTQIITSVLSVSIEQSFKGQLFNYGTVSVKLLGRKYPYRFYNVKDPLLVKKIFDRLIIQTKDVDQVITSI